MTQPPTYYDDEIDLRNIVRVLLRRWIWIGLATFLAAAAALGTSLILPKQYKATAMVALVKPDVIFRFESKIATELEIPQSKGIPDLALSDSVLQDVIDSPAGSRLEPDDRDVENLRESLEISQVDTVIKLSVTDSDPERAAELANAWSAAMVDSLNDLYLSASRDRDMFALQAEEARLTWKAAQDDLTAFQAGNPERVLSQRLQAQESTLAWTLESLQKLAAVIQDSRAVRTRFEERDSGSSSYLADNLVLLSLTSRSLLSSTKLRSMNTAESFWLPSSEETNEVQLLVEGESILAISPGEQVKLVEDLMLSLQDQEAFLTVSIAEIQAEIYDLQGELSQAQEQRTYLEQERDLAHEAYQALARKVQESGLSTQAQEDVARLASRALVPSEKVGPRIMLNTALGGMLGFIVVITWVFLADWWRDEDQEA